MRDTDSGLSNDQRGAECAVAVANQDHGTTPVQRDRHHQILNTISVEIAHIYIGPIFPEVIITGNERLGRLLHESAIAVASQEVEAGTAARHGKVFEAIAVEISNRNF